MLLETAHLEPFVTWAAPIAAALLTCLGQMLVAVGQRRINLRMDEGERKRLEAQQRTEEKRKAEAEWRERVERKIDEQDSRIDTVLTAQCTLMRTDLVHKAHRYVDDLGCAGVEEKQAFWAEYEEYQQICSANEIVNHFVDHLVRQVMDLPDRPTEQ